MSALACRTHARPDLDITTGRGQMKRGGGGQASEAQGGTEEMTYWYGWGGEGLAGRAWSVVIGVTVVHENTRHSRQATQRGG